MRATLTDQGLVDRPIYFVSSNTHSLVNLRHRHGARASEDEIVDFVERDGPDYLLEELERFRDGAGRGLVGELPLLRRARLFYEAQPEDGPVLSSAGASTSARSASPTSPRAPAARLARR